MHQSRYTHTNPNQDSAAKIAFAPATPTCSINGIMIVVVNAMINDRMPLQVVS